MADSMATFIVEVAFLKAEVVGESEGLGHLVRIARQEQFPWREQL